MYQPISDAQNLIRPVSMTDTVADTCNGCSICSRECSFLNTYGNPGTLVKQYMAEPDKWRSIFFECSLCSMCTAVCPRNLDPAGLFLEFRRNAVENDQVNFSDYQTLLAYEKRGISKKYTLYHLPENCDTVFFPGCTLTGTRPETTLKTWGYLKKQDKTMGVVLDCCTKPSHDLGRQAYFNEKFNEMISILLQNEIHTIVVACPSCYHVFNTYGHAFNVKTVYELMSGCGVDKRHRVSGTVTVHDPCPIRFDSHIQASVRSIATAIGLDIIDTPHRKKTTFCCGEGGSAGCMAPSFAEEWTKKRAAETFPHQILSYCTGCVKRLSQKTNTFHILDLFFDAKKTMAGKAPVSRTPFTYLNRLKIKRRLKKIPAAINQDRNAAAFGKSK